MSVDKPPYSLMSMQEIRGLPWNGKVVASLFAGCGGSCLGYRMAGYRVGWANEFIPAAQETYCVNHPETVLDSRDIRQVDPQDILIRLGMQVGELDVLDGSPPCAAFSTAGKRQDGWGRTKSYSDSSQRVDDLFFEFIRILRGLSPKTFVAENVSGLVKGVAKGYFKEILCVLKESGYRVEARLLSAQFLGVPQIRQRLIFQGVRVDLGKEPVYPVPLPYSYTVQDVLGASCVALRSSDGQKSWQGSSHLASPTIVQSDGKRKSKTAQFSSGGWIDTGYERRKFTIEELRLICSFPSDFILTGSYAQQWERLGRAVPPRMMEAIARTLYERVLR